LGELFGLLMAGSIFGALAAVFEAARHARRGADACERSAKALESLVRTSNSTAL
jgi:hypothetical protein